MCADRTRKSMRLDGYDYSRPGSYFVTICAENRVCLFGKIINGIMVLNDAGKMINFVWNKIFDNYANAETLEYVIMPNHFHGIIKISKHVAPTPVGADSISARLTDSISARLTDSISARLTDSISARLTDSPSFDNTNTISANNIKCNEKRAEMDSAGKRAEMDSAGKRAEMDSAGKRAEMDSAPTVTVPGIVQSFKRYTTIEYIKMVKQNLLPSFNKRIWQRNYWDHIIRDNNEYDRIEKYIQMNPEKWNNDKLNDGPGNVLMEDMASYGEEEWMI